MGFPPGIIFAEALNIDDDGGEAFTQCKTNDDLLAKKLDVWYNKKKAASRDCYIY